jgi:hypothetical protein
MTAALQFLDFLGRASTIIVVLTCCYAVYLYFRGILPAVYRLGMGLAHRRIAIFAKGDAQHALVQLVADSGLFAKKNLLGIHSKDEFKRAGSAGIFLVYWPDWVGDLGEILRLAHDGVAVVVHAPPEGGRIPEAVMAELNKERNAVVNNFRGRLMNDLISCLITTSYDKR